MRVKWGKCDAHMHDASFWKVGGRKVYFLDAHNSSLSGGRQKILVMSIWILMRCLKFANNLLPFSKCISFLTLE